MPSSAGDSGATGTTTFVPVVNFMVTGNLEQKGTPC